MSPNLRVMPTSTQDRGLPAEKTSPDALSQAYLAWSRSEHVPVNTIKSRARVFRTLPNAGTATREEVEAWWVSRNTVQLRLQWCSLAACLVLGG
jgi:hypothetical protein